MELLVFLILGFIALFAVVAKWTRLPYPVVFLIGGIVLALIPGMPPVQLAPDVVFLVFLPPLIFGDGYVTDWHEFKRYIRPITWLAVGLVVMTSIAVAEVAHALIGLPLAVGFVLGAILSPTDTVATDAIAESMPLPRRIETIVSGESLMNDATGLVLYKFAIGAVLAGTFSLGLAVGHFAYVVIAGAAVGVMGGELLIRVGRFLFESGLTDETITTVITIVSPYLVYLTADRIGASGVLAAAIGGIYVSRKGGGFYTADARIIGRGVWNTLFFTFNGALFIILGLQLRSIIGELAVFPAATLAVDGGAIAATVIVSRLVWVIVVATVRQRVERGIEEREGPVPFGWIMVTGWAGMRGIVSLAAALAIPQDVAPNVPFPARDLIQFITFVTILVTLIGQGLSLPLLVRIFNVRELERSERPSDLARVRIAEAGLQRLQQLEPSFASSTHWEVASALRTRYEEQVTHYRAHVEGAQPDGDAYRHELSRGLMREVLEAERATLADLRLRGEISDAIYRRLQYDIDLQDSRLA